MELEESLSKMEDVVDVLEDPTIALARKINSVTWQKCCVKAKAAKEETLKKRAAGGGHAGRHAGHGRGGGCGRGAQMVSPTVQTPPWPKHYKTPYFYAGKQLDRQSPAGATMPFIVDVNVMSLLFSEYSSRTAGGEQMGA